MPRPLAWDPVAHEARRVVVLHAGASSAAAAGRAELLRRELYDSWTLDLSRDVVEVLQRDEPDVVVVCWRAHTFELGRLCRDLSESTDARILVVAEEGPVADHVVVDALESGADDFVDSTVGEALLLARLRVAMRARPPRHQPPRRIVIGDVDIDVAGHIVRIAGTAVKCPPMQFQLLLRLAREPGVLVRSDVLFIELWRAAPGSIDPRRLRIAVSLLRSIIGSGTMRPRIETVPHMGYRLVPAPTPA